MTLLIGLIDSLVHCGQGTQHGCRQWRIALLGVCASMAVGTSLAPGELCLMLLAGGGQTDTAAGSKSLQQWPCPHTLQKKLLLPFLSLELRFPQRLLYGQTTLRVDMGMS